MTERLTKILSDLKLERDKSLIQLESASLVDEIELVFEKMRSLMSLKDAEVFFELLSQVQLELATLLFKERMDFPDNIRKFVSDFDRVDDVRQRQYLFDKIRARSYSLR